VVYICPGFAAFDRRYPDEAEATLIHEALHSLGLGENPPSSRHIQARVRARCPDTIPSPPAPTAARFDSQPNATAVSLHPHGATGSRSIEKLGIGNRSPSRARRSSAAGVIVGTLSHVRGALSVYCPRSRWEEGMPGRTRKTLTPGFFCLRLYRLTLIYLAVLPSIPTRFRQPPPSCC
jgi:hypothetical protein